jgi:chromosome segregation ATPase
MEGGPYEQPGYPRRDPRYEQPGYVPPPEYEPPPQRRFGAAEAVAVLALLAAVVAIFLALDARDEAGDDEQLNARTRAEIQRQVQQVRTSLGERAGTAGARARQAESEAAQTRNSVSQLSSQVSSLEQEVSELRGQQNQMRSSLQRQSEAISDLRRATRE